MNGNEVIKKLRKPPVELARINGSHHVMAKGNQSVSIPRSRQARLKPGLIAGIARDKLGSSSGNPMETVIPPCWSPKSGSFFVRFIDVEGAMTDGETLDEGAIVQSQALSRGFLGWMLDDNQPIPTTVSRRAGCI